MIPRHQPAYTWSQWLAALWDRRPVAELEAELGEKLCRRLGRKHAVFYQRGRDAIFAYFKTIAAGRPAIVPAFTCSVVPEAIRNAGSPIIYADIDEATLNMELGNVADVDAPVGAVLIMTHQFGLPCRAGELVAWARARGIAVLEDCAGALGAEIDGRPCGSFGDVAIVSFENTKVLGSGTLGVLLTDDDDIATRLRNDHDPSDPFDRPDAGVIGSTALLKAINWGPVYRMVFALWSWKQGDTYAGHGEQLARAATYYRHRPDPFALALVIAQWRDLDARIEQRRSLMRIYAEALGEAATCRINPGAIPAPIRQPIRAARRRSFYESMYREGIDLGWSFAYAVSPPAESNSFPNATRVAQQILNLPIHEHITPAQARAIAQKVGAILAGMAKHD